MGIYSKEKALFYSSFNCRVDGIYHQIKKQLMEALQEEGMDIPMFYP
jgi:hypothetical protein